MRKIWSSSKTRVDLVVELVGGFEIVAEGLLDDDATQVRRSLFGGCGHAVIAEVCDDVGEVLGRGGEIEEAVAARAVLLVELAAAAC